MPCRGQVAREQSHAVSLSHLLHQHTTKHVTPKIAGVLVSPCTVFLVISMDEINTVCDLCNEELDRTTQYTIIIDCSHRHCGSLTYHQECLGRYLKHGRASIGPTAYQKDRTLGYACPRGKGKGPHQSNPCGVCEDEKARQDMWVLGFIYFLMLSCCTAQRVVC